MMDHAQHPGFQATNTERSPAPPYNGQNTNNVRPITNANLPQRHHFDGMFIRVLWRFIASAVTVN